MKFFIYSINILPFFLILFFVSCNQNSEDKGRKIAIPSQQKLTQKKEIHDTILLVSIAFEETYLIAPTLEKIVSFYHMPVKIITAPLPTFAFFKERNRYRADLLLTYLQSLNYGEYRFVAGLTSKDISCTNGAIPDWGVFGLGSLSAKGCITSSFRLKKNASTDLLIARIQKVILHEIGHNHGLNHCTTPYPCFMKAANGKISEVDNEPMDMCKECRQRANL